MSTLNPDAPSPKPQPDPDKTAELKAIIQELHDGLSPDVAKARFDEVVRDISPREIGAMEEQLIREGTPVGEIQRLCDLHVAIVQNSLERQEQVEAPPGHPAHTYLAANQVITEVANRLGAICAAAVEEEEVDGEWAADFETALEEISGVHRHYQRRENELFPVLERHGITGPSQVMWGTHDEIRAQIKEARNALASSPASAVEAGAALARSVIEMVFKEKKILIPLAMETLTAEEWAGIRRGEDDRMPRAMPFLRHPHLALAPPQAPACPFPSFQPPLRRPFRKSQRGTWIWAQGA